MKDLTHINKEGEARMVDISAKTGTVREAVASGRVRMKPETLDLIKRQAIKKGDVLATARLAGIMAAKNTPGLIPLCHTLLLDQVNVDFVFDSLDSIGITAKAKCSGKTGVEMEALTAVAVAALTIYDMCKAVDRGIIITDVCLEKKSGGKSGTFSRKQETGNWPE